VDAADPRFGLPGVASRRGARGDLPLFLLIFATLYLSLSNAGPSSFSQQLDHTRALYFAITVFSTVGFGDITPTTDTARIIVSIQMLLNLVVIGVVVRLFINAAKSSLGSPPEHAPRG